MSKAKKEAGRSFEESMKRLDEVVAQLEQDKLPLDTMISLYEEGVTLARSCGAALEAAEQKVKLIAKKAGALVLEEFDDVGED